MHGGDDAFRTRLLDISLRLDWTRDHAVIRKVLSREGAGQGANVETMQIRISMEQPPFFKIRVARNFASQSGQL